MLVMFFVGSCFRPIVKPNKSIGIISSFVGDIKNFYVLYIYSPTNSENQIILIELVASVAVILNSLQSNNRMQMCM